MAAKQAWLAKFTPLEVDKVMGNLEKTIPRLPKITTMEEKTQQTHMLANLRMILENPSNQSQFNGVMQNTLKMPDAANEDSWSSAEPPANVGSLEKHGKQSG